MMETGDKLKVYLDTSVISHLFHNDVPEKQAVTRLLWEMFRNGDYDVCLSDITITELGRCNEDLLSKIKESLSEITYTELQTTDETARLAQKMIGSGILGEKSMDDCGHIAASILAGCDCIVSWGFRHIVNIKTIHGARAITTADGLHSIEIVAPPTLLNKED